MWNAISATPLGSGGMVSETMSSRSRGAIACALAGVIVRAEISVVWRMALPLTTGSCRAHATPRVTMGLIWAAGINIQGRYTCTARRATAPDARVGG